MSMIGVRPQIKLPYPHPGQQRVREEAKRFNWLSAGRRWRKTTLAMAIAVEGALKGESVIWGAPTFDQVRIGWNETRHATGRVFDFHQQQMTAHFPQTGGTIIFRSLDNPDNARGHTGDGVVIDEAGFVKQAAWYEVLRQMLMTTNGWAWALGTPNGRNWFWREFENSRSRDDSACWQIPTVGCKVVDNKLVREYDPYENPDIAWDEIVHQFHTLPRRVFEQEIMAKFLEHEGVVFRNIGACLGARPTTPEEHKGHYIAAGVDWGKQNDFTATSIGCANCKMELAIDRYNQIDYQLQYKRIDALFKKWNVTNGVIEHNSIGDPAFTALERAGLPVTAFDTTPSTKPELIENLILVFQEESFQFIDDPIWTGELEAYERVVSPTTGRSQYNAPEGMHDDTVMARALMAHGAVNDRWLIW